MTFQPTGTSGTFLPTSQIFPQEPSELNVILSQNYAKVSYAINNRDIATYDLVENPNGQQFFTTGNNNVKRNGFRKVITISAITAGAAEAPFNHGISGITVITKLSGVLATDVPDFKPIPYSNPNNINESISLRATSTQVLIKVGAGAGNVLSGIVIIEYLKQ